MCKLVVRMNTSRHVLLKKNGIMTNSPYDFLGIIMNILEKTNTNTFLIK